MFGRGWGLERHPGRPCAIPCLRPVLTVRPRTGTGHRVHRSRTLGSLTDNGQRFIDGSRPAHAPPAKRPSYVSFDVRQYRRTIPGIASCGRTAPAAASSSSRHVSPIHGCGRGPDCIGCVERGVGVLGCSAISAWRSSSPTPRHLWGAAMENQQPNWRCRLSIMFLVTVLMLVWIIRRELGTDASR